jgi:hypothetical protein
MSNLVSIFKKFLFKRVIPYLLSHKDLMIIILLSLAIRGPGIMWGVKPYPGSKVDWYEVDEREYLLKAAEINTGVYTHSYHPLGFSAQIAFLQKILRLNPSAVTKNLILGRILSLIYGLGLLLVIYLIANKLWGKTEAIYTTWIAGGIPLLSVYSHLSTANMANIFYFYLVIYLAIIFYNKALNLHRIFILSLCSALGVSMMGNLIILIPSLFLISASNNKNKISYIILYLLLTALFFSFSNWVHLSLKDLKIFINQFHNDLICRLPGHKDIYNLIIIPFNITVSITIPILLLTIRGIRKYLTATGTLFYKLCLLTPITVYTMILLLVDVPLDRYLLPLLPFLAMLAGLGITKLRSPGGKKLTLFSLLYLYIGLISVEYNFWHDNRVKAYHWIISHLLPKTKIYLGRYFNPYEFYFIYTSTFPPPRAEYVILHERYYRRYLRSAAYPFTPTPEYVYHGAESDYKPIQDIFINKRNFRIIKKFHSISILPEHIIRKYTLGSYPDIIGDVIVAQKINSK